MEIGPVEPTGELVSVVVPAYDAEATLRETLESALAQTYRNLEVIVVDDGSRDGTAAVAEAVAAGDPRARLVRKSRNSGLPAARNTGIARANGAYVALLDADDLWHPEKIAKQMAVMRRGGAQLGLVYTWYRQIDELSRILTSPIPQPDQGEIYAALVLRNIPGPGSTALFRRECWAEVGGFDENQVDGCEDLKFCLAVAERFDFDLVPEFLTGYRVRSDSMSHSHRRMRRAQYRVLADARRRHPELPGRLFRRAKSGICSAHGLHLLRERSYWRGLSLLLLGVLYDPGLLLQRGFYRGALRAVGRLGRQALGRPVPRTDARHDGSCGQPFYAARPEPNPGCDTATAGWLMAQRWAYASSLRIHRPTSVPASPTRVARGAHV